MADPVPEYLHLNNQVATKENVALFEAAVAGDFNGVKALLKQGAKPNFFHRPQDQKNALHVAAEHGYDDIVELLLENGAAVNSIAATDQATALILASHLGNAKVLNLLINAGADIQAVNGYGNSALHEAAHDENPTAVDILLKAGAHVSIKNHKGSTPLHSLCYSEANKADGVRIAQALLDAGAEIDAEDKHHATPLLVCCTSGRVDIAQVLLKHGANVHKKDEHGQTAKEIAIFYRQSSMVDFLSTYSGAGAQSKSYK